LRLQFFYLIFAYITPVNAFVTVYSIAKKAVLSTAFVQFLYSF